MTIEEHAAEILAVVVRALPMTEPMEVETVKHKIAAHLRSMITANLPGSPLTEGALVGIRLLARSRANGMMEVEYVKSLLEDRDYLHALFEKFANDSEQFRLGRESIQNRYHRVMLEISKRLGFVAPQSEYRQSDDTSIVEMLKIDESFEKAFRMTPLEHGWRQQSEQQRLVIVRELLRIVNQIAGEK